jgi:hypothetical protein
MTTKLASLVSFVLLFVGCVPTQKPLDEDVISRFNLAVSQSVQQSHADTMAELQEQRSILSRISSAIEELQAKSTAVKTELSAPSVTAQPVLAAPTLRESSVARMPGAAWNVEGNWDYTLTELADHLRRVHNADINGKTLSELQAMHDNLHNGYSASGSTVRQSTTAAVQYYAPTRQGQPLFRRARTYSTCPPGANCPQ